MPKKNEELKAKARALYEQEGFSLARIAQELGISAGTVRSWKSRDKWKSVATHENVATKTGDNGSVATEVKYSRGESPNSLANLKKNKYPNIRPGQKLAEKHGLYSDHSTDPRFEEYLDRAIKSPGEFSQELTAKAMANTMIAMDNMEPGRLDYLEPMSRVVYSNVSSNEKAVKTRMAELEMLEREQRASGTSPVIESIREMTEGFMRYVNEAHSETD